MKRTVFLLLALAPSLLIAGCASADRPGGAPATGADGAFVTLLGTDTLAVERFTRTPAGMEATVVLRAPRTTVTHYRLDLDPSGALQRYEATTRLPGDAPGAAPVRREVAVRDGDSLRVTVTGEGARTAAVPAAAGALPFVDMAHWPFELVVERAVAAGRDTLVQPLFTDRGPLDFRVGVREGGRVHLTHPLRGTMTVQADPEGRLLSLDAGETTRKVTVTRVAAVDIDGLARRFAALDAAGRPFGALSGRGEARGVVGGATLTVDYGRPAMRGREVWGALVPWGQVWRTGANLATHLTTDRDLVVGGLAVPAGRYTLYSVPAPDGGVLIINRQTGQGGTTYDAAQDLGRVPLTRTALAEPVELFTITVDPTPTGGALRLQWDRTELSVPFTVAP